MKKERGALAAALGGLALLFLSREAASNQMSSVPVFNVSATPSVDSSVARIGRNGSTVHVVWRERTDIFYRKSTDNGLTFAAAINISNTATNSLAPSISVSGNEVHVVWQEDLAPTEIFYARSLDAGISWSAPQNISATPNSSSNAQVLAKNGSVYVIWIEPGEVYFRASQNSGTGFSTAINLSNTPSLSSQYAVIDSSGQNVYVAWTESNMFAGQDIFVRKSADNGISFASSIRLTSGTTSEKNSLASISANSLYVHIVWRRLISVGTIMYSRSVDAGFSYSSPIAVSPTTSSWANPYVKASGANVHIIFSGALSGAGHINYLRSVDNGASFSAMRDISHGGVYSEQNHNLSVDDTAIAIAWVRNISPNIIMYRKSTDSGAIFSSPAVASKTSYTTKGEPFISVASDGSLCVIYRDQGEGEIYAFSQAGTGPPPPPPPPPDSTIPTVTITKPGNIQTSTFPVNLSLTGTASDDRGISAVEVSLDNGAYLSATLGPGTTSRTWSKSISIVNQGQHTVNARSKDAAGNLSSLAFLVININPIYEVVFT